MLTRLQAKFRRTWRILFHLCLLCGEPAERWITASRFSGSRTSWKLCRPCRARRQRSLNLHTATDSEVYEALEGTSL